MWKSPLVINHPVQVSGVEHAPIQLAPGLGQHSREILSELGYDNHAITELLATSAVSEPEPEQ